MIDRAASFIREHNSFILATHENPDADTIGSALALAEALRAMGKDAVVFNPDGVPRNLAFLPGADRVVSAFPVPDGRAFILVDFNKPVRAKLADDIGPFTGTLVIDHHRTESDFGQIRWVEPGLPATGLMIFRLLGTMGAEITCDMAMNLYTALAVDTGTFRFRNTSAEAFEAASLLVGKGVAPGYVSDMLYQSWTEARYNLLSLYLATTRIDGRVAFSHVTRRMLSDAGGALMEDTENFVNYPLMVDTVLVSVMLKERTDGKWRVSIRSKGKVDISGVAAGFGGGGHSNASGCYITGAIEDCRARLLSEIAKVLS